MRKILVILLCAASVFCAAPNAVAGNDGLHLATSIVNLANGALNLIRSLLNLGK